MPQEAQEIEALPVTHASHGETRVSAVPPSVPARTVWFMSVSVGLIVANGYYIQPLLAQIAQHFGLSVTQAGALAMLSQLGTASGLLLFVPLGDTRERRNLIAALLVGTVVALVLFAAAPGATWLAVACFLVGVSTSNVHVFVPFAAHLAPAQEQGRVLGAVLSGLLFGILLARTFSGFVGAHFGWRAVYWIAAGVMLVLLFSVRFFLPKSEPDVSLPYRQLLRSILQLAKEHAALRESGLLGALLFAVFSAFWTTLVFLLETPPFHYGAQVAGLFGLVGAVGAAGAPLVGRMADRHGPRWTLGLSVLITFLSFVWLAILGRTMIGLIVGVVVLDLGIQSGHVSNQARIYKLAPDAKSRLNTFYMVSYFIGGSLGSVLGAWSWRIAHWNGVCIFSVAVLLWALIVFWRGSARERKLANAAS